MWLIKDREDGMFVEFTETSRRWSDKDEATRFEHRSLALFVLRTLRIVGYGELSLVKVK